MRSSSPRDTSEKLGRGLQRILHAATEPGAGYLLLKGRKIIEVKHAAHLVGIAVDALGDGGSGSRLAMG